MPRNFTEVINLIIGILTPLMYVLVGLALLAFFKGLIDFISKAGDVKSHAQGKDLMIWGLVALFIMVSFIGLLRFAYSDLGLQRSRPFGFPTLPTR